MKKSPKHVGCWGEKLAAKYLANCGYQIINHHFQTQDGEIDLIALDNQTLVFIEVKTRRSYRFGLAEESITPQKQIKLVKTTQSFMQKFIPNFKGQIRIDIIIICLGQ